MPTAFTAPLREDFVSDGPKLRRFVELFWHSKDTPPGEKFKLDPWQEWLIDHVLERYPADWPVEELRGRLRFEQCYVSLAAQNGKSVIAAVLGLYGLTMHVPGPTVLGLSTTVATANLVYAIAKYAIEADPYLSKRFVTTGTRGIKSLDETRNYRLAPGDPDKIQGITASLILYDELHLTSPELHAVAQMRTTAVQDSMIFGITTAGDDQSVQLKTIYETGHKAIAGDPQLERYGFFLWEAPEGADLEDPAAIMAANPSVACGRKPLAKPLNVIRTSPEAYARQYVHNRFVASSGAWMPNYLWTGAKGDWPVDIEPTVIAVDKDGNWKHATFIAAVKHEGVIYTEVIETRDNPSIEFLEKRCLELKKPGITFVMHKYSLGTLAERLDKKATVKTLTGAEMNEAASTSYALIAQDKVKVSDPIDIIGHQLPYVVRKNVGAGYKVVPAANTHIEAVYAQLEAIWAAENIKPRGIGIY